jgi:hypothetical protein
VPTTLWPAILWSRALRIDGPDLDEQAIFQGRDALGDTYSFIESRKLFGHMTFWVKVSLPARISVAKPQ